MNKAMHTEGNQKSRSSGIATLRAIGAIGACAGGLGVGTPVMAEPTAPDPNAADGATPQTSRDPKSIVVTGIRSLLGDKIPQPLKDAPQSVNVLPQRLLQEQSITRLEDALKNVPGVTLNAGEGAARGDTINIRGFSAFNDFFLDGIRDAAVYVRDPFNLDSIEVLKGPSATLFGRGSTGGAVNQVSKAPTLAPLHVINADVGTNDEYRGTADFNQPLGPDAAFRLNAMGESSHVADRDDVRSRHWGVAPELSLGIGRSTSVTLAYYHLTERDRPDSGIPFVNGAPAPVDRHNYYGLLSDHANSDVDIGTVRIRHEFGSDITLANTLRYASYRFNYQFDAPNFGSEVITGATPLSSILVGRDSPSSSGAQTNFTEQLDLTARFDTGALHHTLVAGIEIARQTNMLDSYTNPFNRNNAWIAETSLLNPDPNELRPNEPVSKTQHTVANSEAAYITDTINVGSHVDLVAGVRVDRFEATSLQTALTTGKITSLAHTDVVASPRVALIYKPVPWQSFYASYGTSFDPSAEALTLTTATSNLGPVKATSYEVGSKTSVLNGGLLLTAALFHTEVNNAQVNDPENPTTTVLQGNLRVQGFELGATGHLTSKLEVTAGYTYLDGVTSGTSGTTPYTDQLIPNLARNAANLWVEYDVTHRLEIGGGLNYLDHRAASVTVPVVVPGYVVWNAMTAFEINDRLKLQVNAINIFNKLYYDNLYYTSPAENHVLPGAGRTVRFTLRASF